MQKLQSSQNRLVFENSTYQVIENHLQNKVAKLNETVISLQNENKQMKTELTFKSDEIKADPNIANENTYLYEQNIKLQTQFGNYFPYKVQFDETCSNNKARPTQAFAKTARDALWFADTFGLTPKAIKCESKKVKKNIQVNLETQYCKIDYEDERKLRELILYILDKFCISDAAYHELASANCELRIQERAAINNMFKIERCPGNVPALKMRFLHTLETMLCKMTNL